MTPIATKVIPEYTQIKKSMSMSVHLNGVYIAESYDAGMFTEGVTNDLLIVSSFQTGTSPTVQRIHYYKNKQEIHQWIGNFFKSLVCSFTGFNDSHITLRLQIYDIDDYEKWKDVLSSISSFGQHASVTFPVIAPYVTVGLPAATGILELVDKLDEHDKIIDDNLRLEITLENVGTQILQTGHWIYFKEPQEVGLKVNSILQVIDDRNGNQDLFNKCSYGVYSIRAEEDPEPQWEIDQKMAKLLSELDGKEIVARLQ